MKREREYGFYWVKLYGTFMVAKYTNIGWLLSGSPVPCNDGHFTYIGEQLPEPKVPREPGFYWVENSIGNWVVAEFNGLSWLVTHNGIAWNDDAFSSIDETPIKRAKA